MRKFNRVILFAVLCAGTLFIILSLEGEQDALMERSTVLKASALTLSQEPLDRGVQSRGALTQAAAGQEQ